MSDVHSGLTTCFLVMFVSFISFQLVFANEKPFCSCQIGAYVGDALFHKYFLSARPITSMNPIFA